MVEPDVDQDGLGDESQDPDGGGLGMDWESDWFDDFEAGDQLDEDASTSRRRSGGGRCDCSTWTASAAAAARSRGSGSRAPGA